jgi:hypothetical protein
MAEVLGDNAPVFEVPVDCLMTCPDLALHHEDLCWVGIVLRALDLVREPTVAIVGLNSLRDSRKRLRTFLKILMSGYAPGVYLHKMKDPKEML